MVAKLPPLSEKDFLKQIIALAQTLGWSCAHFKTAHIQRGDGSNYYATPVQADGKGFPDLVLLRPPRLLFIELKTDRGRPTPGQCKWQTELNSIPGVHAFMFRPSDWDRLVSLLSEKGGRE